MTEKPVNEFIRNRARFDGLSGYCWPCHLEFCTDQRQRTRQKLVEALGGKCMRCGYDDDWRALQIDHIRGNGAMERRNGDRPHIATFRAKVIANPESYSLLCANCNQIKRIENAEHIGRRIYRRIAPTQRTPVNLT
jgi:hypothetical protein